MYAVVSYGTLATQRTYTRCTQPKAGSTLRINYKCFYTLCPYRIPYD